MKETPRVVMHLGDDEPGYAVGVCLDELVAYAIGEGCSEDELRERMDEAIDRSGTDD